MLNPDPVIYRRKMIFGMVPWMFWTLLAAVLFTFSPFLLVFFMHLVK